MAVSVRSLRGLDWLSFFLANVRDGLGPYLAIYLLAAKQWSPSDIGLAMAIPGFARILAQTPAGAFIDNTNFKRGLIVISSLIVAAGCFLDVISPAFGVIISSQILIGIATSVYTPTIAAITLGMVGYDNLARRIGRNESFNHIGNVCNAIAAGLIGHFISYEAMFYLISIMCVASSISVLFIKGQDIDHNRARAVSENKNSNSAPVPMKEVIGDKGILLFAAAVFLFSFSNGSMISLAGQKLCVYDKSNACLSMSACIIVAQMVMIFFARFAGKFADKGKRKSIFLISFIAVPLRGLLFTLSDDTVYVIAIQVLDGISGGIFGVLTIIMIADLTEGTGRFNFIQGMMTAIIGIGASLSSYVTGFIVNNYNYNNGFLFLSFMGILSFIVVFLFVPETRKTLYPAHQNSEKS